MASLTEHGRPNSCDNPTDSGEPRGNLQTPRSLESPYKNKGGTPGKGGPNKNHSAQERRSREARQKPARSVTTLYTMGSSFSQPATLSLSQGTSNAQPEKGCSVSSQVAVTCGCTVLHVQSNDLETMASFTLSVHSSSTRTQAYLGCWSVCSGNPRAGAHKSIKMEKGRHSLLLRELDMVRQQPIRIAQQCRPHHMLRVLADNDLADCEAGGPGVLRASVALEGGKV